MNCFKLTISLIFIIIILIIVVVLLIVAWNPENFSNKIKNNFPYKILVTLTTSPKRIKKIKPVISSIMKQSVLPDVIVLNLPHIFKRDNSTFDKIPKFITDNPLIIINRCEDIGPATKVLPIVELFKKEHSDTIIISIDDDIYYESNMIKKMLKYTSEYPEAVLTGKSRNKIACNLPQKKLKYTQVKSIQGFSGVLYRKKFLENFDYDTIVGAPKCCYLGDDFTISNHLAKNNIPILVVNIHVLVLAFGNFSDALHLGANGHLKKSNHEYDKCKEYLKNNNKLFID